MGAWLRNSNLIVILAALALAGGCKKSPPSDKVKAAISQAVVEQRKGVELSDFKVEDWQPGPAPESLVSTFTAKLKLTEPVGYISGEINGKNVVHIVAPAGEEIDYSGKLAAEKQNDAWNVSAFANLDNGWKKLDEQAGPLTMGYNVIGNPSRTTAFRRTIGLGAGCMLLPISDLNPSVLEKSEELKTLLAQVEQDRQKAQAMAVEMRRQAEEKRKTEAESRLQAEAEKHRAKVLPLLAPLKSKMGVAIVTDAGINMGSLITDAQVDEQKLTASGKGLDLRQLPFKEFTFDATIDPTGQNLIIKSSTAAAPMAFARPTEKGLTGSGMALVILSDTERAAANQLIELGKRISAAAPADLPAEILDAAAVKTRQPKLHASAIPGTFLVKGRNTPAFLPLFAGNVDATKAFNWPKSTLQIRLAAPGHAKGLYIKAGNANTEPITITINGVHHGKIDSIPKNGAAIVSIPIELEITEILLESQGAAQARAITLLE